MFLKIVDEVNDIKKIINLEELKEVSVSFSSFDTKENYEYSLGAENVTTLHEGIKTIDFYFRNFKKIIIKKTENCLPDFIFAPSNSKIFLLDKNGNNIDKF